MELSQKVRDEIGKRFGDPDCEAVASLLSDCQSERVRLAILRLSRGNVERVRGLIADARRDYRDVLAWAAQPTRTYIVGLLRKGPNWTAADERGTHLTLTVLRGWKESGAVRVGGWFTDFGDPRGLYIFTLDSIAGAEILVQGDPAVAAGKLRFEFHPWLAPDGLQIASPEEL